MKKSFLLLTTGVFLSFSLLNSNQNNKVYKADATSKQYTTNVDTYYQNMTASSGNSLLGSIHDLIVTTHKTYSKYDDVGSNGIQKYIDQDPNNTSNIIEFYSQVSWPSSWNPNAGSTGGYNREHVWCQSLSGGLWGTSGGGADMHHIRPDENRLNSTRGNNKYGYVTHSSSTEKYAILGNKTSPTIKALGGYCDNKSFEPIDASKGDVARILMYMYTHYNNASNVYGTVNSSQTSGNLPITNIVNASNASAAWDMLLEWNELDPVSIYEINRNNRVSEYQGNRNPFIDYPDLANCIWGDDTFDWKTRTSSSSSNKNSISLNKTSATIYVNDTLTINATTKGDATLSWANSNSSVVSMKENGSSVTISALKEGSAVITATFGDISAKCNISVKNEPVLPTSLTVSKSNISLDISTNSQENVNLTLLPSNADNKVINISSSNSGIVSVPSSINANTPLTIKGVKVGTTVLTLTCEADASIKATINVSVIKSQTVENEGYNKISSINELDDGQYLIVCEGVNEVFNGSLETLDVSNNGADVDIDSNLIVSNESNDKYSFTIKKTDNKYSILSSGGSYIGGSANSNGLTSSSKEIFNSISFDANGDANIINEGGAYLRYYKTSGQNRFRYYKSDTYTKQTAVQLYKLVESVVPSSYTINDFAQDFLNLTGSVCALSSSNNWKDVKDELLPVWNTLNSSQYYLRLNESDKETLKNIKIVDTQDDVLDMLNRYHHIIARYNLDDFMNRSNVSSLSSSKVFSISESNSNIILLIVCFTMVTSSLLIVFKTFRKHN